MKKGLKNFAIGMIIVFIPLMLLHLRCNYIIKNTCLSDYWMATMNKKCIRSEFKSIIRNIFSAIREKLENLITIIKWKFQNFFHI